MKPRDDDGVQLELFPVLPRALVRRLQTLPVIRGGTATVKKGVETRKPDLRCG